VSDGAHLRFFRSADIQTSLRDEALVGSVAGCSAAPGASSRVPQGSLAFTVECLRRSPFTPMRGIFIPWPVTNASGARPLKPRYENGESFLTDSQDITNVAAALVLGAKEFVRFDARQGALGGTKPQAVEAVEFHCKRSLLPVCWSLVWICRDATHHGWHQRKSIRFASEFMSARHGRTFRLV
jgi:hypothetical protein